MTKPSSVTSSQTDPFSRKYKIISKIGEGSYSEVLKCKNRENGSVLACKRLKHCYRSWNQVNDIPEIVTLRKLARHPNILQMAEIHFDPKVGRVSLVFELMDMNLYELIKDRKRLLPEPRVRVMMFQLIRALRHLHKHGIFHRDVKPENILLKNDLLKLGDLGSVRGLYSQPPYTEYISTRWYRSPECLLTCGYYSFKMDVWAAGCVFYEILTLRPLFPGSSELDQINRVHNVLGPPPHKILQKFDTHAEIERDYSRHTSKQARLDTIKKLLSELKNSNFDWYFTRKEPKGVDTLLPTHVTSEAKDLLKHLLQYDPDSRPSSHRALQHAYFKDLREQAQRAAKGKMPSVTGPIVTIVGDEGGTEVLADDNANPVDLATLGDEKLKYKQPQRRASEQKEIVTLSERQSRKSTIFSKDSTMKLQGSVFKQTGPILNEAGEIFARETNQEEIDIKKPTSTMEPNSHEDRAKFVARRLANLQKFGGDAIVSNLPFQKIYLAGDADEGDGLNIHSADLSASQLDESKRKKYHSTNNNNSNSSTTINQSRRRESSKTKLNVERKKSKTLLSNETSSSRAFPLDFIDKTSLTPDVITRINENRRIAHMQPIENLDLNVKKHLNNNVDSNHSQSTTSGKDTYYTSNANAVHQLKQLRPNRSLLPTSPTEFSPRTIHHQLKHGQKPMKLEHNHVIINLTGSPSAAGNTHNYNDNGPGSGNSLSSSKYGNRNYSTHANNTNKQVKELIAAFPLKRNIIQDGKIVNADKAKNEHMQGHILDGQSDRSSYRIAEIKQEYSKSQLAENLGALRTKYEAERKGIYQSQTLSERRDGGNNKDFNLERINSSNVNPKKSVDKHTKTTPRTSELPKMKQNLKIKPRDGRHDRTFIQDHDHRDQGEHKPKNSSIYEASQHQNPASNSTRKTLIDIKDIDIKDSFNRRELSLNKDTNVSRNYSDRHEKDKALRQSDFNTVPNRDHQERGRDGGYEHGKPFSDRALRDRDHHHNPDHHHRPQNTIISERKNQNHERSLDSSPIQQKNVVDSTASLSPNKIRRVIEHRRKAQLVTTDTEADGDNLNLKSRKIDSLRRRRRSKNATDSSNLNTSRTTLDHQLLSINTNNLSDYPPRIKQQPFQVLPQRASDTNRNYHSNVSRLGAAATIYSNQVTTNKQVREILAEMRKRRDVLEEKVTIDTIDHRWTKSPRAEDSKIKYKNSESVLKRTTEIPRRHELGESHYSNKANHNTKNHHGLISKQVKHGHIQGQVASVAELSPFRSGEQKYSNRQSADLDFSKAKLRHQVPGSLKCPESESKIKGVRKATESTKNSHQNQTGAGSKLFPRNR